MAEQSQASDPRVPHVSDAAIEEILDNIDGYTSMVLLTESCYVETI